jgi:hypothetical protein
VDPKYSYSRELEPAELDARKERLAQNMIKIDKADQVLKEAKQVFTAEAKPMQEANKILLYEIRTRSEEITGEVYLIKDEHEERMGIYSPEGILIMERGLLPEERQYNITDNVFNIAK